MWTVAGQTALDEALAKARSGDDAGFLVLWDALQPRLLRYLQVIGCDDVDDVAGETWLQVVRDLPKFKRGSADEFRAWLFTIGRHRAIDAARSRRRHRDKLLATEPVAPPVALGNPVEDEVLHQLSTRQAIAMVAGLSRDLRRPLTPRLAAVGAALVVAVVGATTAAYTQALPTPVQDLAHTVFAPLGVPDNQQPGRPAPGTAPGTGSSGITVATSGGTSGKTTNPASTTPSPRPGDDYLITVAVSRIRVPTGGRVTLAGRVTSHGGDVARARARLFERLAGSTQFELVATGVTGPLGGFKLSSPPLTTTAVFRVVGPGSAHSVAVRVAVAAPKITARAADAAPGPAPTG